ncbi:Helix-turn-helix domain protein [compost metagenome]
MESLYWRSSYECLVEVGISYGTNGKLPTHFHVESQLTFVVRGKQSFKIKEEYFEVCEGHGIYIPAGTPHSSDFQTVRGASINSFMPAGDYNINGLLDELESVWSARGIITEQILARTVAAHMVNQNAEGAIMGVVPDEEIYSVKSAASLSGITREGYTRMFTRKYGISPYALWLTCRLNAARRLLRLGYEVAEVAADMGFYDQSHLGRHFRKSFGISPGKYRRGYM